MASVSDSKLIVSFNVDDVTNINADNYCKILGKTFLIVPWKL